MLKAREACGPPPVDPVWRRLCRVQDNETLLWHENVMDITGQGYSDFVARVRDARGALSYIDIFGAGGETHAKRLSMAVGMPVSSMATPRCLCGRQGSMFVMPKQDMCVSLGRGAVQPAAQCLPL